MTRRLAVLAAALLAVVLAPPASAQPAPPDFVALADVDPTILQEIRYYMSHNFVGDPIDGYQQPMCILTREAARDSSVRNRCFSSGATR